jgi:hypothetical protein
MKYKEAYNHATSVIAELQRDNKRLKQLLAVALAEKMRLHNGLAFHGLLQEEEE